MPRRSGWVAVFMLILVIAAGALASATNNNSTKHSASVSVHDDPALIQTANELMHNGSSAGEYIATMFPEAWNGLPQDFQEFLSTVPMGWSGSGPTAETHFSLPKID